MDGAAARILDAPPPGWDALLATDPNATPAHRPALWMALAQSLDGMSVRFIAVERAGALLGGGAVLIQRRVGFHWLHALPFMLPGAPLARPGEHRTVDEAVGVMLGWLQKELGAVGGAWSLYRPAGPEPPAAGLEAVSGETRMFETSVVELQQGIEETWGRIDPTTRSELRRARERRLRFIEDPERIEEAYSLHVAQARRWPGYRPLPLELARRLLAPGTAESSAPTPPPARLFCVTDGREMLSAALSLDHPRETLLWWAAARERARALHATPFLYWSVLDWAKAAGRARLNLGGSLGIARLQSFKRGLGAVAVRYPVRWMDASRGRWPARTLAGLQAWVRRRRFRGEAE